jgi:hypothetical protein
MDPLGVALVMCGIVTYILAVEDGGQKKPWDSSTVIGLLVGSVLIWTAFAVWEYFNKSRAMLPGRLLRKRVVWQPSAFQFFFAASYFVVLYYLPIYFQSIDNRTAISSGVLNLPLVLALTVGSTISGTTVMKTGYAAPFQVAGAVIGTVSAGLIYTFDIGTPMGKWIGYQILYGIALGIAFQMAITIAQANASMEDMSSVTAIVFCKSFFSHSPDIPDLTSCHTVFQTIGGAFAVSAAQSAFVNRLLSELARTAPGLNPQKVQGTGATQIRHAFPVDQVPAIISAYMAGIKVTFAITVALVGFSCVIVAFTPWKRLNADALKEAGAAA